jgi:hypothetical protein
MQGNGIDIMSRKSIILLKSIFPLPNDSLHGFSVHFSIDITEFNKTLELL